MKSEAKMEYIGKCLLITHGKTRVLVVGDLHLGYEEALNRSGVFVSRQMFKEMIEDFDEIFDYISKTGKRINARSGTRGGMELKVNKVRGINNIVDKIVLLGDIKHDFGGISGQEWGDVKKLVDYLKYRCREIVAIKGNHDNMLEPIAKKMGLKLRVYWKWKEFCFLHGDRDFAGIWKDNKIKTLVVGHGHPAIKLREGAKVEKYKCFLTGKFRGKHLVIVPSFIEYYAGSDPREGDVILAWDINFAKFNVRVVGEGVEVLDFGKLNKL